MIPISEKPKYNIQDLDKIYRAEQPKKIIVLEEFIGRDMSGRILRMIYGTKTIVDIVTSDELDRLKQNSERMSIRARLDPNSWEFKDEFEGRSLLKTLLDRVKESGADLGIYLPQCICCRNPVFPLRTLYDGLGKNSYVMLPKVDDEQIRLFEAAVEEDKKSQKFLDGFDLTDVFIQGNI